jgi:transcriptional activator, tipA family, putative
MMYQIKEAAQLSGVSVKTLHHYDKIGLLVPQKSENGYRLYSEADLERLQIILFYKYLGFSLKKIAELLSQEEQELLPHLNKQLQFLQQEREHLDTLISTLQKTIQAQKGERKMTTQEKFVGFTYEDHANYYYQAVETYGQEVMDESRARQVGKETEMTEAFNKVFRNLANNMQKGLAVDAQENLSEAEQLFQAMNTYAFDCSLEVFAFIGKGYVANPEFKKNIDQFGVGTAQYVADVIQAYVHK